MHISILYFLAPSNHLSKKVPRHINGERSGSLKMVLRQLDIYMQKGDFTLHTKGNSKDITGLNAGMKTIKLWGEKRKQSIGEKSVG